MRVASGIDRHRIVRVQDIRVGPNHKKIVIGFHRRETGTWHLKRSTSVKHFNGGPHRGLYLHDLATRFITRVHRLFVADEGQRNGPLMGSRDLNDRLEVEPYVVGIEMSIERDVLKLRNNLSGLSGWRLAALSE